MYPTFAIHNSRHLILAYSKGLSDKRLANSKLPKLANVQNVLACKFAIPMALSANISALARFICVVGRSVANPQVIRINATWIVASRTVVQHAKTVLKRAVVNQPRRNMGSYWVSLAASESNVTVAARRSCHPNPAAIGFVHLWPKTGQEIWGVYNRVRSANVDVHSKLLLLCRALGHSTAAGVFSTLHQAAIAAIK